MDYSSQTGEAEQHHDPRSGLGHDRRRRLIIRGVDRVALSLTECRIRNRDRIDRRI